MSMPQSHYKQMIQKMKASPAKTYTQQSTHEPTNTTMANTLNNQDTNTMTPTPDYTKHIDNPQMLAQGVPLYKFSVSGSNGNPMMSSTEDTTSNVFPATDGMMADGN